MDPRIETDKAMNNSKHTPVLVVISAIVVVTLAALSLVNPAASPAISLFGILGVGFLWVVAIALGVKPKASIGGATFDATGGEVRKGNA